MKPGLLELLQIKPGALETPLSMRFSCKVSSWKWVAIKAPVGTKPVITCQERWKSYEPAQLWLAAEAMTGALSKDVAPSSSLSTCLSAYFTLPPLESSPYKVHSMEVSLHCILTTICVDLYMPRFFKKSQTWRQAVSHPSLGMGIMDDGFKVVCTGTVTARQG